MVSSWHHRHRLFSTLVLMSTQNLQGFYVLRIAPDDAGHKRGYSIKLQQTLAAELPNCDAAFFQHAITWVFCKWDVSWSRSAGCSVSGAAAMPARPACAWLRAGPRIFDDVLLWSIR